MVRPWGAVFRMKMVGFVITGLPDGSFKLEVSFLGYETRTREVIIGSLKDTYNLGDIFLSLSALQLDQVSVEAQRAITSSDLDKKSFGISDQISQSGGSVLDVIKNLPGISVDQEGKVMLRGSDPVATLTDGKQKSLTGFGKLILSVTDLLNTSGLREEITGPDFTALYENYYKTLSVRIGCRLLPISFYQLMSSDLMILNCFRIIFLKDC